MHPARPTLDIVIVTARGSRADVGRCLESLRARPYTGGEQRVVVVDNASADGTEAVVRGFDEVAWVPLDRNAGFGRASNLGVRATAGECVLLLNPDTEVGVGTLDACARRLLGEPGIGIVGCRLHDRAGRPDPNAKRTLPTRAAALRRLSFADRLLGPGRYHTPALGDLESGPVGSVSGAFMVLRRAALAEIGLLDEGYWMYGEDLDLCARAAGAGWVVWYEGSVAALHVKGGTTAGRRDIRLTASFHRAMGRYYRRHLDEGRVVDLAVYAAILARLGLAVGLSAGAGVVRRLGEAGERGGERGGP